MLALPYGYDAFSLLVIAMNNFISKRKELSIPNTKRKESEMGKRSNQKKENKREVLS